jgi:hypothetical protein
MHIHGNLNVQATSLGAANSARAENAERAAETRRRLYKAAQSIDATATESTDPDASYLVGEWLSVRHNHALADDRYTRGS